MAASRDADAGRDVATANAPKTGSPLKDKRSSVPDSEASTKTAKKRRKVNHGMAFMLCT
jgi:hypothetical protein